MSGTRIWRGRVRGNGLPSSPYLVRFTPNRSEIMRKEESRIDRENEECGKWRETRQAERRGSVEKEESGREDERVGRMERVATRYTFGGGSE